MEWKFILWGLICLLGLYLMGTALYRPFKYLIRLGFYFVFGGLILFTINLVFSHIGMQVAINPVTMLTAGILQLPGVILLLILNYLFL